MVGLAGGGARHRGGETGAAGADRAARIDARHRERSRRARAVTGDRGPSDGVAGVAPGATYGATAPIRLTRSSKFLKPPSASTLGTEWVAVHTPRRQADKHQMIGDRRGYTVRLVFDEPISGPLRLGHSSSFGLGLFAPAT